MAEPIADEDNVGRPEQPTSVADRGRKGEGVEDPARTPGDGSLDGAVPAGLSSEELRKRADTDESSEPGTS
ncbi:hypothetical protein [Azospirillum sp. SYSU D00513]|uniref:hypothetical protein n=1 Tax=Azospirillum sp. SYSU D00513 TaxID=2812561 RepID=UPI001A967DD7|nr:hypothetical protein [Azospirillum sp. SYSU D00513]